MRKTVVTTLLLAAIILISLPLSAQVVSPDPQTTYRDTTQNISTGGLWRIRFHSGIFEVDMNTAPGGGFTGYTTFMSVNSSGQISFIGTPSFPTVVLSGSSSGNITLKAPSVVTTYTLTFPANSGTANYAFITDGSGNGSWVSGQSIAGLTTGSTPQFAGINVPHIINTGTLTLPTSTDTLTGRATTDTLTNKTISGSSNTLTNIGNVSLTNSSVTISTGTGLSGGTTVSLGGTATLINTGVIQLVGTAGQTSVTNGGSGTVTVSLIGPYTPATYTANGIIYGNGGSSLQATASANSSVLITSSGGTPSLSQTLPIAVQTNITELGTITTGVWNGTAIGNSYLANSSVTITAGTGMSGGGTVSLGNTITLTNSGVLQLVGTAGQTAVNNGGTGTVTITLIGPYTPATYTSNGVLFGNLGSSIQATSSVSSGVLVTSVSGTPSLSQTLPSAVQANIATVGTIGTGTWQGTAVALAYGGTNANLTASAGGIVYSGSSALAILGGTATANQMLLSGSSAAPVWSTVTHPATTTVNQILYSSANNVLAGLATGNNGVLITSSGGAPSISSTLPAAVQGNITALGTIATVNSATPSNGQFLIGNGSGFTLASITAGTGVVLTPGAGSLSISVALTSGVSEILGTANQITASGPTGNVTLSLAGPHNYTTLTANGILYGNGSGAIQATASANNGVLVTSASGTPSLSNTLPSAVQLNITSTGVVTTGTWNGTAVGVPYGGTGLTSTTVNQLLYSSASGTIAGLATGNSGVLVTSSSGTPSISATLPSAVQANITGLGTITAGTWNGSVVGLAYGGSNANLTASNGGIIYSTASAMAVLAGTATQYQVLLSGATGAPAWSSATYPATTTHNQLLYSSADNTIAGLSSGNSGVLVTSSVGTPSISQTLPLAVQANITVTGTIGTGVWQGTAVTLAYGGLNANLTASNGGIFYSTSSAGAVLAGTATANQVLLSGSSSAPAWSSATYPASTTVSQLLYSSSSNVIAGLATGNNGVLVTGSGGVPSISSTLPTAVQNNIVNVGSISSWNSVSPTDGAIPIGGTSAGTLVLANITPGSGISVTNGAHTITIASTVTGGVTNKTEDFITLENCRNNVGVAVNGVDGSSNVVDFPSAADSSIVCSFTVPGAMDVSQAAYLVFGYQANTAPGVTNNKVNVQSRYKDMNSSTTSLTSADTITLTNNTNRASFTGTNNTIAGGVLSSKDWVEFEIYRSTSVGNNAAVGFDIGNARIQFTRLP